MNTTFLLRDHFMFRIATCFWQQQLITTELQSSKCINSPTDSSLTLRWLKSQSYFTTAVYRQSVCFGAKPLENHDQRFFFLQLDPCDHSSNTTPSLASIWVCLLRTGFVFVMSTYHTYSMYAIYKSSVSTGFAKQIMSILLILRYNGSLVTWTVVSLITARFKPLIFSIYGFALFYTANTFILIILYGFPLVACTIPLYNRIHIKAWKPRHGLQSKHRLQQIL
jgi:hypothetical protein